LCFCTVQVIHKATSIVLRSRTIYNKRERTLSVVCVGVISHFPRREMAGPQCGENPPQELGNPSPSMSLDLKGRVETLGHLTAYVSYGSRDIQKAVILVSDVYGIFSI